jgi:hypothetical protein
MVEVVTLRDTWQDGKPVPAGSVVSLSESDARYAESIGRVQRVEKMLAPESEAPAANEAPATPIKRGRGRPRKDAQ